MYHSQIKGLGKYVPEKVVTNHDLEKIMDTSDDWIVERTGIHERRHIEPGDGNSTAVMGCKAAKQALERAKIDKDGVDLIVFATLSPDYYFPGCGVQVQEMLEIDTCPALDVRNQCSGFIYGLSVADQFIKTGMYKTVLLIGSENHSGGLDMTTRGRNVSVIFGDGAGAAVLQRTDDHDHAVLSTHLHSQGKFAKELSLVSPSTEHWVDDIIEEAPQENPKYYPYMNGQLVFKNAVVRFSEVIMEGLQTNQIKPEDVDLFIAHQANLRIAQFIQKKFKWSDDQVYNNIQKYGNTTAASIPIALTEAWEMGKLKSGDNLVLSAFGSGFTWGSAIIKW